MLMHHTYKPILKVVFFFIAATDTDYERVQGVIAHEYFHNWTGNRCVYIYMCVCVCVCECVCA